MNITKITPCGNLGSSPAIVNRNTGEIFIDKEKFANMTPEQRAFVLLHEAGHARLGTRNELAADNYAADYLSPRGYSLRGLLKAETRILNDNKPAHRIRANNLYNRLANFDISHNNNNKIMKTGTIGNRLQVSSLSDTMANEAAKTIQYSGMTGEEMSGFKPFQFIKDRVAKRGDAKNKKIESKANLKNLKGQSKIIKANAKQDKAKNPEKEGFFKKVGGFVKENFGKKNEDDSGTPQPIEEPKKDNKTTYIIIAVVVVIVIVAVALMAKKGKK